MIRTSRITKSFMSGKLLCLAACLALAGALMFPGTSFGAWVTDSFHPSVTCNTDRPDPLDCVHAVVVQSDGSVIVGGYISSPGSWLARFTSAGNADTTFNNNVNSLNLDDTVDKIVIQPDNKIIIGGHFTTPRRGLARLTSTGTLDTSFNPQLDNCDPSELHVLAVTSLAMQADGNLLVGGTFKNVGGGACPAVATPYITTGLRPFFARLMTAGTGTGAVDTAFIPNVSSTVHSIIPDIGASKQIMAAGNFYKMHCTYCGIASQPTTTLHVYNPGTADQVSVPACTEDNGDGLTYVDYGQCMSNGSDLVNYVVLLNSNGSRDTSFQSQRDVGQDLVYDIARQSDGKVLVGGAFNPDTDFTSYPFLQRLDSSGNIDGSYTPNANGPVKDLALQSGDNLITAGSFTVMGGATRNSLARLTSAGGLDATFAPSANGPVAAIYSSPSGTQITVGGGFTSIGGVARSYVARLINDNTTTTTTTISAPLSTYGTGTVTVTVTGSSGTPTSGTVTLVSSGPTTTWTKSLSGSNIALFPVPTVIAGDHALSATYGGTSTYAASSATGVLTVTKAILTVTANSVSRQYLSSNPTFTATYTGFVNNETVSVLSGTPLLTTTATLSSPIGTYPISAATGSLTAANYSFGFVDGLLTVTPTLTTTSVVSSSPTSSFGNSVTFIATVVGNGATGTVTFKDGGATLGAPVALSGGTAAYGTSLLSAGTHTITAVYSGDASFGTSTSSPITQTVNKASTTTNAVSSLPTAAYGSSVTFTATVTSSGGIPAGNVTFMDGATTLGSGTLSGGSPNTATFTTSALGVAGNPHLITAVYSGDASFGTSTSSAITQTINQSTLTPAVSSSVNPSAYGIPVMFTATVTGATGTITFKDGEAVLGTATLISGMATYTTSTLSVSGNPHSITAVYGGDVNFAASTSNVLAQNITQATSTTFLMSSLNPSVYGIPVTFTATISGAAATGTVTFRDGSSTLGTGIISGGTATYTTSALSVAGSPHSVTAVYGGDANYGGSISGVIYQTVDKVLPVITVVSSLPTSTHGNPVTFTATVEDPGATGTVTFRDGAATLGSGTLSGGSPNTATYTTSALGGGPHSITAAYSGDGNFLTSTSGVLTQTVNKASTTTDVHSSLPTSTYGNSVTFTATVTGVGATGTVTFMDGVTSFGTGTLSSGSAAYTTSALGAGGRLITAVYNGDGNFATSTSGAIPQTVNKASTATNVVSSSPTAAYGSPVTFTATIAGAGATGTVTFMDGAATLGTGVLSGGSPNTATFTTSALGVAGSPHMISAVYGGDPNHTESNSSPVTQTTTRAGTTTSITSDFQTAALNTPVTFTATVTSGATGTVQFYDNGTTLLDTKTLSSGLAVSTISTLGLGNHQITAIFSGDSNFNQSSTVTPAALVVVAHTSLTTILSVPNPSDYGTLATFNSTVTGDSGVPTGTVTFKDGATTLGMVTLSNGFAQYSTSTLGGGAHSITATYSGDANYGTSTSSPLSQTVNKANQTITFGALAAKTYGNADFAPGATANSNLPVTYISSNTSVAMVAGSNIHIVGAGNATITASQAGDNNYNAATSDQLLIVNKANQTIIFGALAAKTYGNADFAPGATAGSNLPVTYISSNTSVAMVSGSNIHIVGAGNTTITASQAGSGNYNAAADVPQTLTVNKANQTITFSALAPKIPGDTDFSPGATASSNRPVTYTSSNTSVAMIAGNNVHIVGLGTTTITAWEGGDDNCNAAAQVQQPLNVVMADGKLDGSPNAVSAADALESLRIAVGIDPPTQSALDHGDVAPLVSGQRRPDGKIDLADVVAILRKAAGLSSW